MLVVYVVIHKVIFMFILCCFLLHLRCTEMLTDKEAVSELYKVLIQEVQF